MALKVLAASWMHFFRAENVATLCKCVCVNSGSGNLGQS